jgi:hypothetical protein
VGHIVVAQDFALQWFAVFDFDLDVVRSGEIEESEEVGRHIAASVLSAVTSYTGSVVRRLHEDFQQNSHDRRKISYDLRK